MHLRDSFVLATNGIYVCLFGSIDREKAAHGIKYYAVRELYYK